MTAEKKGRPRQRRKEARPGEIIDAGLAAFAENGFAGTRLDDVARRAGIAKGTIYVYFDNKEALFQAAVRSKVIPVLGALETLIESYPGTTRELLGTVFATLYDRLVRSDVPVLMRIIIAEGQRFPDIPAYYYQQSIAKAEELLRRIIRRGIDRGEFQDGPILDVPIVLVAPAIVAAVWQLTFAPIRPLDLDKMLEAHVDIVFRGLLKAPQSS